MIKLYEKAEFKVKNKSIILEFKGYEDQVTNNNNDLFTAFLIKYDKNFRLNNSTQYLDEITIFSKEYFERKTKNKEIDFAVHHCYGSWYKDDPNSRSKVAIIINNIIGDILYDKLQCYLKLRKLPYYKIYLEHKRK